MADPALIELAISSDSDEAARARALRLLGFAADLPVRGVAVHSQLPRPCPVHGAGGTSGPRTGYGSAAIEDPVSPNGRSVISCRTRERSGAEA